MFLIVLLLAQPVEVTAQPRDCSFQANPDAYLSRTERAHREVWNITSRVKAAARVRNVAASSIKRENFIDDYIFGMLEARGVAVAPIAGDEEFLRRITLDLTGRLPSPEEIRTFVADDDAGKRNKVIESLLTTDAFLDKWTMYFGDILKNNSFPSNFDRQQEGRNAYHLWIREALKVDMSLKDFAIQLISGTGNSFDVTAGPSNYPIASKTPMGPIQDTYDTMLAMTASTFLGLGEMDCLLCHNGRGHLEQVNVWGAKVPRTDAWRMAAFFSRLNMPQRNVAATDRYYRSFDVSDRVTGTYDLNTNTGNRPDRMAIGTVRNLTPEYIGTGETPKSQNWREEVARMIANDPMFARNWANRLWREMFNLALVEPVDSMDPARLDVKNPPPEPWTLQASHPELLDKLADFLKAYDYNLRGFVRTIVQSNAYQLSSRYDGEWKYEYIPLFARHYPRRLMAEEVHDVISQSTKVFNSYTVKGFDTPMTWAMQFPEPAEPRVNGAVATFLNLFLRGNRDTQPRSSSLSILQEMNLMNDQFITNRTKVTASPALLAVSRLGSAQEVVEELSLLFLSRKPTAGEIEAAVAFLGKARDLNERTQFIEDLAWAMINKPEFLFSY